MKLKVDSRKIEKGDTFLALRGVDSDGHDYIESAIKNGASKIIAEHGSYSVDTLIVKDTRKFLSDYLKDYYKEALKNVKIIGITGTNGKTTCAYLVHKAFNNVGIKASYIGTIGFYIDEKIRSLSNTTPDLYELYQMINESYNNGCSVVVMEVSSQGIAHKRVIDMEFDIALFTNLTQDHLDYHKTMENYALAKKELFKQLKGEKIAIINYDDSYKNYYLLKENNNKTYGFTGGDYHIKSYNTTMNGTSFDFEFENNTYKVNTSLFGKFNIYNSICVISILHEYGLSLDEIISSFNKLHAPVGRLDTIHYKDNLVIVDYAHTPDAIENILSTVKELKPNNIYTVFGATGDRDRTKRPIMRKLVLENCKYAIITNDDPHNEDPMNIVKDLLENNKNDNYEVELDRVKAIQKGIDKLKSNDLLLILGKGHEEFMIIKDEKIPMNDKKIVLDYIKNK